MTNTGSSPGVFRRKQESTATVATYTESFPGDACGDVLAFPPLWEDDVRDVVDGVVVPLSFWDSSSISCNKRWSCSSSSDALSSISWTSSQSDSHSNIGPTAREARKITLLSWQNPFLLALAFSPRCSTHTLQTHVRSAPKQRMKRTRSTSRRIGGSGTSTS